MHPVEDKAIAVYGARWKEVLRRNVFAITKLKATWIELRNYLQENKYDKDVHAEIYCQWKLHESDGTYINASDIIDMAQSDKIELDLSRLSMSVLWENKVIDRTLFSREKSSWQMVRERLGFMDNIKFNAPQDSLTDEQYSFYDLLGKHRIVLLSGGPGTGKSHLINHMTRNVDASFTILAPTAKAAMRIGGSTIHRALRINPDDPNPRIARLASDIVVVDESSMLDSSLFYWLLKSAENCRLILVGDGDQLPPVGKGAPFLDLLQSLDIPSLSLNRVFRQAEGSEIGEICADINVGNVESALVRLEKSKEIIWRPTFDVKKFEMQDEDFQIISPQKKFCDVLNWEIRPLLNKNMMKPGNRYAEGDRIILTRNVRKIDHGFINGHQDLITSVDYSYYLDNLGMGIEKRILHSFSSLAYAITVHKAQGSEWNEVHVVIPPNTYRGMMTRNFLYTAFSRAKKRLFVYSPLSLIQHAIKTPEPPKQTIFGDLIKSVHSKER